jgi:hypothetical protein
MQLQIYQKQVGGCWFFCLFSKLTLVASMEYPVLTVLLCFKISNFYSFVYTDKMSAGSVFFFLDPFLEWYCYLWFLSNWYFLNTIQFRFSDFYVENLECSLIHLSSTSCWYWQCFRHRHLLYSIWQIDIWYIFCSDFNERHLNPVFVFVRELNLHNSRHYH